MVIISNLDSNNDKFRMDYSNMYNICLDILSYRLTFLKLVDIYIYDSQIISLIFRMFRKVLQIVFNDNNLIDDKIISKPQQIHAKEIKVLLLILENID
jgi:hypothetical protein